MEGELEYTEHGWYHTIKHSMHRRCNNHDYADRCIYMVTMVTKGRHRTLGELVANPVTERSDKQPSLGVEPYLAQSETGKYVSSVIESIPKFYPTTEVIAYQLMPVFTYCFIFTSVCQLSMENSRRWAL